MELSLVILAAGLGSRYGGLKQMDKFGPSGESIIEYSIFDAIRAGFTKVVFVIRPDIEKDLKELIINKIESRIKVEYVFQDANSLPDGFSLPAERLKPWGTAHAVLAAEPKVNSAFVVINADDFYGRDSYRVMADYLKESSNISNNDFAMLGFELKKTLSEYGTVSRGICTMNTESYLEDVVERTNIGFSNGRIVYVNENGNETELRYNELVSMNFWGFQPIAFKMLNDSFKIFLAENINNHKAEFYIPWAANEWIKDGTAKCKVLSSKAQWFGVTYREDRPFVEKSLNALIESGEYPDNLWK